ncbi:hypothetical protein KGQ72_03360 [Patescibacteria group bacterium]|nr:hypothetical protein [Patescibacteria group bacterium]
MNNSGNTVTVLPVAQAPVTYPVQYMFPQPVPNYQNLTCAITASPNQVQAGQYAYLQWQSSGAVSATLSGYGNVAPSGSLSIRPTGSQNYILTVYGQNGQTTTCNTLVTIGSAPRYPSVTLSQIPYTGFDFGSLGDAMYWVALAIFALASGYLLVYYKGGMAAFAGAAPRRAPVATAPVAQPIAAAAPIAAKVEVVAKPAAPVLPTLATGVRPTSDSMKVAFTDGAPRIVISRN